MKTKRPAVQAGKGRVNGAHPHPAKIVPGVKIEKPGASTDGKAVRPYTGTPVKIPGNESFSKPAKAPDGADAVAKADTHRPEQVEIGPKTRIAISLPRLKAALAVCTGKDDREALNAVYLQSEGHTLNIVATDGKHMLISRMWTAEGNTPWPSYLEKGVSLDRGPLARAIAYLAKDDDVKIREQVTFEYASGATTGILMDYNGEARFRVPLVQADFPKYKQVVEDAGRTMLGGESVPLASTDGIAKEFMKAAGLIATALEAKAVQVIAPTESGKPWLVVYPGSEGVLHIIMPMQLEKAAGHKTLALIGNGNLKGSLAALRATITMKTKALAEITSPGAKAKHQTVIDSCKQRITAIEQAMADNTPKLAGPKPETKADAPAASGKPPKARKPHGRAPAAVVNKAAH